MNRSREQMSPDRREGSRRPQITTGTAIAGVVVGGLAALGAVGWLVLMPLYTEVGREWPVVLVVGALCLGAAIASLSGAIRLVKGAGGLEALRLGALTALAAIWVAAAFSALTDPLDARVADVSNVLASVFLLLIVFHSFNRETARWLAAHSARPASPQRLG
ncbi:hypothetical protein GCM10027298_18140 [Epidermidibacterium keratini]